jgi:hypothetical protein
MPSRTVSMNRAPVLTLWAAVVARRLGFDQDEALTLGRAVAGLNAYSKGRRLGLFKPHEEKPKTAREKEPGAEFQVELCGRAVPARNIEDGIRATQRGKPIDPDSVERYLEDKFGDDLDAVRSAMEKLAGAYPPKELAERCYRLYEAFRPAIPSGTKGWGPRATCTWCGSKGWRRRGRKRPSPVHGRSVLRSLQRTPPAGYATRGS